MTQTAKQAQRKLEKGSIKQESRKKKNVKKSIIIIIRG